MGKNGHKFEQSKLEREKIDGKALDVMNTVSIAKRDKVEAKTGSALPVIKCNVP